MNEKQSSYRQIMKAASIFGGVQVLQIIIKIVRSKILAVLLGPVGIGINGLLQSTIDFIGGLTNFGLKTSAVKNVAIANSTGDESKIAKTIAVLRRLVWATGLLGVIVTVVLSGWLSQITFGNKDYTLAFVWLSITLLFNQLSSGQLVVLQGMRKLKALAKAGLAGAVLGLILTVPVYYVWGVKGIVPAIILISISTLMCSWFFARQIELKPVDLSKDVLILESKEMLTMGLMLSISGLYALGRSYGIRAFISNTGGLEQVGLYTAGFAIVNTYVNMVFTAMSTDYFPRLSAVSESNSKARTLINQQAEIAILILGPLITVFIIFISWIIFILYSKDFLPISEMVQWAMLGMFFKASSWSMAFIYLAKGHSKLFLLNELIGGTVIFCFNIVGYILGGLTGMGIGFFAGYLYYAIQVWIITKRKYEFSFQNELIRIFIIQLILAALCFFCVSVLNKPWSFVVGIPFIIISILFSCKELNKRIDIKNILTQLGSRKK